MTGLRPYKEYRTHQTPLFEALPAHWNTTRARYLCDIGTGSGDTIDAEPGGRVPFYVRSDTPLRATRAEFSGPAVLTAGDGAGVAKIFHLVRGEFAAHQRVYVLRHFRDVSPAYFFYYFSCLFSKVALDGSAKSTVDSVRRHMISDMPFALPSPEEQAAITSYLERETARIDTLISK